MCNIQCNLFPRSRQGNAARTRLHGAGKSRIGLFAVTLLVGMLSCDEVLRQAWGQQRTAGQPSPSLQQRNEALSIRGEKKLLRAVDQWMENAFGGEPADTERPPERMPPVEPVQEEPAPPAPGIIALTQMLEEEVGAAPEEELPTNEFPRYERREYASAPSLLTRLPPATERPLNPPSPANRLDALLRASAETPIHEPAEVALQIDMPEGADRELFPMPPLEEPVLPGDAYLYGEPVEAQQVLSAYKSGFFQKLSTTGTWLANGPGIDDLGVTEIESYLTVALPAPITEWPLLITPAFNIRLFQGPRITDLPPRLYDTYVDFMWVPQFTARLKALIAVTPSYYSDFQQSDSDAFRIQGKALGIYDWNPGKMQVVAGLLYLDRDDVVVLPAGGLIWTPAPWARYELLFPQPKLSTRFNVGPGFEDWVYFTSQWGGSTYSIERLSGAADRVTWTDFRLLLGVERKLNGGAGYRFETGYVLGRQVRYASGVGDFDPSSTWLIRGGITF